MVESGSLPSGEKIQSENCFVCGRNNARGLNIPFFFDGDSIRTSYAPGPDLCGFDGLVHGGIIYALADEAMMHLIWASELRAVTAEITVRYHAFLEANHPIEVKAWFDDRSGRVIRATCDIRTIEGSRIATAKGKFLPLKNTDADIFRKTF